MDNYLFNIRNNIKYIIDVMKEELDADEVDLYNLCDTKFKTLALGNLYDFIQNKEVLLQDIYDSLKVIQSWITNIGTNNVNNMILDTTIYLCQSLLSGTNNSTNTTVSNKNNTTISNKNNDKNIGYEVIDTGTISSLSNKYKTKISGRTMVILEGQYNKRIVRFCGIQNTNTLALVKFVDTKEKVNIHVNTKVSLILLDDE